MLALYSLYSLSIAVLCIEFTRSPSGCGGSNLLLSYVQGDTGRVSVQKNMILNTLSFANNEVPSDGDIKYDLTFETK